MGNYINGFLVVIKSWAEAAPYKDICRTGDKEDRGIERAHPEEDVVADHYAKRLVGDYMEIAKDGSIEPYGLERSGFDAIRVGRVL